ncbi:sushi, von Willebrand factor type A, EGF and pentraxin domain-containing protein 1-like [Lingula anatina]|uniref:Sushi, von Willebrand factor type A, EGF and pentraxin domain-containing protein 1-like n=1 Tax=Lingula anatina TaxID=7574 RepID=A0A1S3IRG5_LINAN|nr:sushi, von Willebrand factor type A, EGF and pentraxin domain-containing protein 1-like [Lingula anatina]|eukprot:XP_013400119.1 sushi, von Willebrand factor type A, EGF and pentraxin domain-containing protein 1-like [Lingula anatina]
MKRFCALILTATLLLNEGNGISTTVNELSDILKKIVAPCTTEQANCKNPALDIVFALDSSSNINDTEFKMQKNATKAIADFIDRHSPITPDGTRVGALTFATDVVREFELNEHTGLEDVLGYIYEINNRMGDTNIELALETAQLMFEDFFLEESPKLIWLHTDGVSNLGDPIPRATSIKNQGWTMCVVSIGNHADVDGIDDIASPGCVVKFGSFTEYANVARMALGQPQIDILG